MGGGAPSETASGPWQTRGARRTICAVGHNAQGHKRHDGVTGVNYRLCVCEYNNSKLWPTLNNIKDFFQH